jgi:hypothetical protein
MNPEDRERVRRYVDRLDRQRATLAEELEEEIASVRGLTLEERGEWVASVCRSAWAILRSRRDLTEVVGCPDPPAPDFDAIWRGLMARRLAARGPRAS